MKPSNNKKVKFKHGRRVGDWKLVEKLGAGGNGDVWKVTDSLGNEYAMKILRQIDDVTYRRFKSEVHILENVSIDGVIDLVDSYIPDNSSEHAPWFVMPLAKCFEEYKRNKGILDIISDFVLLARTLEELHKIEIVHRDIKPENILFMNGRLLFTDFGLVKYPNREAITPKRRDVGAKFTMAPEMRRDAESADGRKADVYSFAKSIWIAISGNQRGFDGQYIANGILGLKNFHKELYLTSLDELINAATDNDPVVRPSIGEFADGLEKWLQLNNDFQERNLTEWFELQNALFPFGVPDSTKWTNIDSIVSVINELSKARSLNHMFFPDGGGHTIMAASRAAEEGMIALHVSDKMAELLKPKKLTYETFGVDPSWDYFRLEAEEIEPSGINNAVSYDGISEALTEIEPGQYAEYSCWDYGEYNGEPLSDFVRPVRRYLKGSFVFFCTASVYNQLRGKYDAYNAGHNKITEDQFRDHIQNVAEYFASKESS